MNRRARTGAVERDAMTTDGEIWPVASAVRDDGSGVCAAGTLQRPPRVRLGTPIEVAREMARVYREMRSGALELSDGTKLIFALTQIGRLLIQAPPETCAPVRVGGPLSEEAERAMRDYLKPPISEAWPAKIADLHDY